MNQMDWIAVVLCIFVGLSLTALLGMIVLIFCSGVAKSMDDDDDSGGLGA